MRIPNTFSKQSQLFVISFACMTTLILGPHSNSFISSSSQNRNVQVKNGTEALEAVEIEQGEQNLTLRLKNITNKNIDGYTLLLGDGGTITTDYTNAETVLAPGKTTEAIIPLETSSPSGQGKPQQSITILAVTFTDRSSEGNDEAARDIKDRRVGIKLQLKRITALIKNVISAPGGDAASALTKLQSLIQALPEQAENIPSLAVRNGLYDAKQDALMMVQKLEQKRRLKGTFTFADLQGDLTKALAEFEKRDSRL